MNKLRNKNNAEIVFAHFWLCGMGPLPRASYSNLLWQLDVRDNKANWDILTPILKYLTSINAIVSLNYGEYRVTDEGIRRFGSPRRKDGMLGGISYEISA